MVVPVTGTAHLVAFLWHQRAASIEPRGDPEEVGRRVAVADHRHRAQARLGHAELGDRPSDMWVDGCVAFFAFHATESSDTVVFAVVLWDRSVRVGTFDPLGNQFWQPLVRAAPTRRPRASTRVRSPWVPRVRVTESDTLARHTYRGVAGRPI